MCFRKNIQYAFKIQSLNVIQRITEIYLTSVCNWLTGTNRLMEILLFFEVQWTRQFIKPARKEI